jgi:hypothetical protein
MHLGLLFVNKTEISLSLRIADGYVRLLLRKFNGNARQHYELRKRLASERVRVTALKGRSDRARLVAG